MPGRAGRRLRRGAIAGAACVALGCHSGAESESGSPPPAAADALSPDEIARLTMLGYADSAPEAADPRHSGALVRDAAAVEPGTRLVTNHRPCRAVWMDVDGRALREWSRAGGCPNWVNARLLADGRLLVIEGKGGLALHGPDGAELWRRRIGAHHDARPIARSPGRSGPDRFAVLLHEQRRLPAEGEAPPAPPERFGPPLPAPPGGARIIDDSIAVVAGDGRVLEQQSIFDLLDAEPSIALDLSGAPDALHTNSVQWMGEAARSLHGPLYAPDHVLISVRNQDLLAIVDWASRRIVWHWGRGELDNQHDATLLPDGRILVFDNGLRRGWSRVLEVDPRANAIVWQYGADEAERFFSKGRGAVQRLPNGNTLISVSDSGTAFEVTPERRIVWEFHNPVTVRKADGEHRAPMWLRAYPPRWGAPRWGAPGRGAVAAPERQ